MRPPIYWHDFTCHKCGWGLRMASVEPELPGCFTTACQKCGADRMMRGSLYREREDLPGGGWRFVWRQGQPRPFSKYPLEAT